MASEIKGLVFAGYVSDPRVNNGAEVPLYEPAGGKDRRQSINTAEGWNALVERMESQRLSRA